MNQTKDLELRIKALELEVKKLKLKPENHYHYHYPPPAPHLYPLVPSPIAPWNPVICNAERDADVKLPLYAGKVDAVSGGSLPTLGFSLTTNACANSGNANTYRVMTFGS